MHILDMRALCLITVKPGKADTVVEILKKKRKIVKQIMVVTGRADISVILQGNIDEINGMVIDFKKIKDIVTTETLIEVEVNLGW
ncbi:6-carboxytetrahydropterin synthase [Nitrosopumilus zosterae]|nr:6-carboxytetrahydropterin synthase [Nitrosopumilus zosterae]BDQ30967.1 6-carboxytetrahydropterin synthase [Nitrosopumilus zosterae]